MRKFIITLMLLAIFGGTLFFIGWTSFLLEPMHYGVLFSKTGRWQQEVIRPGDFAWHWERLIPTNSTLYQYQIETQQSQVSLRGTLPSADHYSRYLEGEPDFSYQIDMDLEWTIDPADLPSIAQNRNILPDDISSAVSSFQNEITQAAEHLILQRVDDLSSDLSDQSDFLAISEGLASQLTTEVNGVKIQQISIHTMELPDISLYHTGRELYQEVVDSQREAIQEANARIVFEELIIDRQLEALRTYGEIISEYPMLLEYFTLSAQHDTDPLRLNRMGELLDNSQP